MNLILHDICYFLRQNRIPCLFALGIQIFLCIRSFGEVLFAGSCDYLSALWPVMSGAQEYQASQDRFFQLPAYWFLFHMYLHFLIGFYPAADLNVGNGQTLVRAGTRQRWLTSKLFGTAVVILLYYGCFFLLLLAGNRYYGGSLFPENGILGIGGLLLYDWSPGETVAAFFLLPLLVSTAMGLTQVVASLFAGPVPAFTGVVAYMIASVFWKSPLLFYNFSMLYRQDRISGGSGIGPEGGVCLCFGLCAAAVVLGRYFFGRRDFLPAG